MIDLDQPRCEGCHAPLEVVKHDSEGAHYYNGPGLQVWPDGLWSYTCECDWEHNDGTGPFPSWRRFAPELCAALDVHEAARAAIADALGMDRDGDWFADAEQAWEWIAREIKILRREIEVRTRERDEARAEVRALCGEPEALDPFLHAGWSRQPLGWVRADDVNGERDVAWVVSSRSRAPWRTECGSHGDAASPLAAMRAADKALSEAQP